MILAFAVAKLPLVAFVARIYYPPSDKRQSHYEVYVSHLDGSHRMQLTERKAHRCAKSVRWISPHELVWLEYTMTRDSVLEVERRESDLVCYDLRTGHRIVLSYGDIGVDYSDKWNHGFQTLPRGAAIYSLKDKFLVVTAKGLSVVNSYPSQVEKWQMAHFQEWDEQRKGQVFADGVPVQFQQSEKSFSVTRKGKTLTVPEGRAFCFAVDQAHPDRAWVSAGFEGRYIHPTIYSLDWTSGRVKVIDHHDLVDIDAVMGERYWGGNEEWCSLQPYGKKVVWARKAWTGDWTTGKKWLLLKQVADVEGLSIQPTRNFSL